MTKILAERTTLIAGLLGLLTFFVGLGRSSEVVVALGIVGLVYCLALPPVMTGLVVVTGQMREMWRWLAVMWLFVLPPYALAPSSLDDGDLGSFGPPQWAGISGFVAAGGMLVWIFVLRYREAHKTCPDCAETVLAEAKVCRYCGFRWVARPTA